MDLGAREIDSTMLHGCLIKKRHGWESAMRVS